MTSRREFIKISGATVGAATVGSGFVNKFWGLDRDAVEDPNTDGDKVVPTFCELCFWKCGVLAHVRNGRVTKIVGNPDLTHNRSHEYGSTIIEAIETNRPAEIGGNVLNNGLIPNLPPKACVEVPCLVNANGVQGCYVGDLPEPCAAYNRTNINPQLLTIEAVLERRRDRIYQAAMLDPHTAAELSIDQIRNLCDDLIEAHGRWLPKFA